MSVHACLMTSKCSCTYISPARYIPRQLAVAAISKFTTSDFYQPPTSISDVKANAKGNHEIVKKNESNKHERAKRFCSLQLSLMPLISNDPFGTFFHL